jgi:formylglycine-generating enzyme required for sulfatase activity
MKQLFLLCCLVLFSVSATVPPKKIKLPKAYVYIPSGQLEQDGKQLAIQGFFMQATEVTNLHYREFLAALERQGRTADLEKARVRPEGWNLPGAHMEPFAEHYHQHPAFENYPVVNITREAALLYCAWLEETLQARHPDEVIKVRLPSETEWMYAARAGHKDVSYPHGNYLRNSKGQFLYNFRRFGDESIHRNPETGEIEVKKDALKKMAANVHAGTNFGPAPAKSFFPNDFDLYHMSGNVAEMVAEIDHTKGGCFNSTGYDIRIDAPDEFAGVTGASPFIGFRPLITLLEKK